MTIEEVKEFLSDNKDTDEVKAFLAELIPEPDPITGERVDEFLKTEDGQKLLQPITDRRVEQAIKTYRENHYDKDVKKAVAEEMLKRNPTETPEQQQIRELREEMEKEKAARAQDKLRREIVEEAARQGVPSWWVDSFSGNTIEEAKVFMQQVKSHADEISKKTREEILNNGHKPGSGVDDDKRKTDLSSLSQAEIVKLEMEGKLDEAITG